MNRTLLNNLIQYILKLPDSSRSPPDEPCGNESDVYEDGVQAGEHGARLGLEKILQDHSGCICPIKNCRGEPCQKMGCKCCQGSEQCNGVYHLDQSSASKMICSFCEGR